LRAPLITRGLLLLILAAGVYFFHGFLVPALAALIIGFATWPLYRRLVGRCSGNTTLAASLAILVVLVVLVVPLSVALHYAMRSWPNCGANTWASRTRWARGSRCSPVSTLATYRARFWRPQAICSGCSCWCCSC